MAPDPFQLQQVVMLLKDAGVSRFACEEYELEFHGQETSHGQESPQEVAPARLRGRVVKTIEGDAQPLNYYQKAFRGELPTFKAPE